MPSVTRRSQRMVMGFLVCMWLALVAILIAAPEIYDRLLQLGPERHLGPDLAFLAVVSAFLTVLATGVARGWTWTFWLVLVAFLAGILRARSRCFS